MTRDEKLRRAQEILRNPELKQTICNEVLGASHKDIERAMVSIIEERQLTPAQIEQMELETMAPDKFDLKADLKLTKAQSKPKPSKPSYTTYSREDVAELLLAGEKTVSLFKREPIEYATYTQEQVRILLNQ